MKWGSKAWSRTQVMNGILYFKVRMVSQKNSYMYFLCMYSSYCIYLYRTDVQAIVITALEIKYQHLKEKLAIFSSPQLNSNWLHTSGSLEDLLALYDCLWYDQLDTLTICTCGCWLSRPNYNFESKQNMAQRTNLIEAKGQRRYVSDTLQFEIVILPGEFGSGNYCTLGCSFFLSFLLSFFFFSCQL